MNGIINVYKPKGISSHDVVYKVRRALGTKKVGHTGTLDPMAEGVLPVCVGKATKAAEYITASEKEYFCSMAFGAETDTQDSEGVVTKTSDKRISRDEFEKAALSFTGELMQTPPMYSAVRVNGKRLYRLAREGIEVERAARKITVFGIEIADFYGNGADITVRCSKGTYIRTLCEDIGRKTGALAHMTALKRTKSGAFSIENSVPLDEISEDKLIPVDKMFDRYERIDLNAANEKRVLNGVPVHYSAEIGRKYRVYGENGNFLCISAGAYDGERTVLKMLKSFY